MHVLAGTDSLARPTHRVLSSEEVLHLAQGGLVEVAAHTATHPVLSALPAAAQRDEILGSKTRLEAILPQPVVSFAYPYGAASDYTEETVAILRAVGFDYACSSFSGAVRPGSRPLELPRFLVRDWDGEEFARRLWKWTRN